MTVDLAELNKITGAIIESAIEVHRELGPGLLESAYEACLAYELIERGHKVERQLEMPIRYKEVFIDVGYRIDLLVDDLVIVELKAVDEIHPIHEAQLLSYLKLGNLRLGLLLNFNSELMKQGIKRIAN